MSGYDVDAVRARFPALAGAAPHEAALDNAATTHRPQAVLDAAARFAIEANGNVHRATHRRAREATEAFEGARRRIARFLGVEREGVVFTRNATEAVNLVARGWAEPRLGPGKHVVVSALEHHSDLVPWQQVCRRTGATLSIINVDDDGFLESFEPPDDTVLVAVTRVSNAIGTIVDPAPIVRSAHARGAAVLLDATQAIAHLPSKDVYRTVDFLVASAHKAYGPTGLGLLAGRPERLAETEPVTFGGEMVEQVGWDDATWAPVPLRFEAGTPPIAQAVAFTPALDLIDELGLDAIRAHELGLLERLLAGLAGVDGVTVVGPTDAASRSGSVSFDVGGDPHAAAVVLDMAGVAVRAGFHCAEPLLRALHGGPTVRASVACYTAPAEIDALLAALPDAVDAARLAGRP